MTELAPQRIWVIYAPDGKPSSGPAVIDEEYRYVAQQDIVQDYREMGWRVEGPYELVVDEGTRPQHTHWNPYSNRWEWDVT